MFKRYIANTAVRKAIIFSLVFVMAAGFMGVQMALTPDVYAAYDGEIVAARMQNRRGEDDWDEVKEVVYVSNPNAGRDRDDDDSVSDPSARLQKAAKRTGTHAYDAGFVYLDSIPLSKELQVFTWERCQTQDVDYALILALMWRESRFQTQAVNQNRNGTYDSGIMQINDVNKGWLFRELDIDNLLDPYQNITAGTEMMGRFVNKYGEHDALMAYQYGESGMKKKQGQGVTTSREIEALYQKRAEFQSSLDKAYAKSNPVKQQGETQEPTPGVVVANVSGLIAED